MRKWLTLFVLIFIAAFTGWLVFTSAKKLKQKDRRNIEISLLPQLAFQDMDGKQRELDDFLGQKPIALILYNSECEHCQYEAQDIVRNIEMLKDILFIFLSYEEIDCIRLFGKKNGLSDYPNIIMGKADYLELNAVFQSLSYPNIFIYNTKGELLKEFKGETKAEAILKVSEQ